MRLLVAFLVTLFLSSTAALAEDDVNAPHAYKVTAEDRLALTRIEKYLTAITTVAAEFIQTSPNGDVSQGKFFLQRPGKLRMEYSPPTPVLMVASDGDIVYFDKELDQVTHVPLGSTLVGFLARPEVKFDNTVIVTDFSRADKLLRVSLVQSDHPKDGALTLEFTDYPLVIRKMTVSNSSGQNTIVSLNNARFGSPLAKDLFIFKDPHLGKNSGRPVMK